MDTSLSVGCRILQTVYYHQWYSDICVYVCVCDMGQLPVAIPSCEGVEGGRGKEGGIRLHKIMPENKFPWMTMSFMDVASIQGCT